MSFIFHAQFECYKFKFLSCEGQTERQMAVEETVDIIRVPTRTNNGRANIAESESRSLTQIPKFSPTASTGDSAGSTQRKRSRSFRLDVQIAFKCVYINIFLPYHRRLLPSISSSEQLR